MASKFRPGIPDTFTLNVTPVQDLGDYLDEPPPSPRPQRKAVDVQPAVPAAPAPTPAVEAPVAVATPTPLPVAAPVEEMPVAPVVPQQVAPVVSAPVTPQVTAPAQTAVTAPVLPPVSTPPANTRDDAEREERMSRPKAPRREISMTPETLRMSDELLEVIQKGSGQRDTKANELFHALVLLVHEAMDEIDTHSIPKRGRWGTPTARAYPLELKNAFLKALLKKYGKAGDDTIELRYPIGSAA